MLILFRTLMKTTVEPLVLPSKDPQSYYQTVLRALQFGYGNEYPAPYISERL